MNTRWGSILLIVAIVAAPAYPEIVDRIAATVDTEVILLSDVLSETAPLLEELRLRAPSQQAFEQERQKAVREALDTAIERRILYREAQLAGIEVSDKDVEERLSKIIQGYNSIEEFRRALEEAGESMSDFRESLRRQIMAVSVGIQKRRAFERDVVISDADARQYYQDHQDEYVRPERVRLRRVFLSAGAATAERVRAKARLEAIAEEARMGADFVELAKQYSEGPEAAQGGLMGWVSRGDLVAELESAAFALPEGGVGEPVETQWGYHLLKSEGRENAGTASFEEARTEIEPRLRARYADERYKKWIADLRERSRVRIFL
ncbi:MAG TPA: peptidylprolyl isomerase [Candidatus Hydrogenedentes bacterium]|nr:peptidylprolyl isomerase [Candidatus Hydrogenedentota bacterium]HNT86597.1 peptidylprolyl isomerase [Candidatus Hydrogenedentota bacterium]